MLTLCLAVALWSRCANTVKIYFTVSQVLLENILRLEFPVSRVVSTYTVIRLNLVNWKIFLIMLDNGIKMYYNMRYGSGDRLAAC